MPFKIVMMNNNYRIGYYMDIAQSHLNGRRFPVCSVDPLNGKNFTMYYQAEEELKKIEELSYRTFKIILS